MNLYGNDMDETVTPLESNLAWTVAFLPNERQFIGRGALEAQLQRGVSRQLVGLVLEGKGGIMRQHQKVWHDGREVGELTSGGYAPTLETSIGFARIAADVKIGAQCQVEMRDKLVLARVVKLPFVRQGKQVFSLVEGFEGVVK
ncbi:MAG: Aminomethyltransferase [uncultured bacterium]|nr:MAG: Aminomethyltransferase [uncultured bacterium]